MRVDVEKAKQQSYPPTIEIVITGIEGVLMHSSDFTKATVHEKTTFTVSGTLDIPNQNFALPIRQNNGALKLFLASVVDGKFSVDINFNEDGAFVYSNNECNLDLPYPMFTVKTMRFDVLSKIPT